MKRSIRILALLPILFLASCDGGGPSGVDGNWDIFGRPLRPRLTPEPTLENIWPSIDRSEWTFDLALKSRERFTYPLFETIGDVPAQPTLEQVLAALPDLDFDDPDAIRGDYSIRFDGTGETQSGVTGKRLVSDLNVTLPGPGPLKLASLPTFDLRGRLGLGKSEEFERVPPMHFISDGIWAECDAYVGYYNDLDREARFHLATDNFSVGSHWSTQTVPSLAPDVWLHAQVLQRTDLLVPAGYFKDAVRILYVFDTGAVRFRDIYGAEAMYTRSLIYAVVDFVPGVGPAAFREVFTFVDKDEAGAPVILPGGFVYEGFLDSYEIARGRRIPQP